MQALRDFRDVYMATSRPGRQFIRWYYLNGPSAAEFIDRYPFMKPLVRALLTPFVVGSLFMLEAPPLLSRVFGVLLLLLMASLAGRRFWRAT